MTALSPALYIILIAILSTFALLLGPSIIDRYRGVGYKSPSKDAELASRNHLDDSQSSKCLDTSASPLVSCFETSGAV